jgi:hypothetical protein
MKRLSLLLILSLLFTTSFFASFNQQIVEIYPQPDSPLQLTNPVSKWRISKAPNGEETDMLTIDLVAQNISGKTIRAYTIRHFYHDFKVGNYGTSFRFTLNSNGLFKPNQLKNDSLGEFGSRPKPKKVKLAVDFVEFTDGSTWGEDLSNSVEKLVGIRAGVKAEQEYLLKINRENGIEAVIKAIDNPQEKLPPNDQSDVWKRGFRMGVRSIRNQIKRVYEKEGVKAAEVELQRQFFSQTDK